MSDLYTLSYLISSYAAILLKMSVHQLHLGGNSIFSVPSWIKDWFFFCEHSFHVWAFYKYVVRMSVSQAKKGINLKI